MTAATHLAVRADHDRVAKALPQLGIGGAAGETADRWCLVALPAGADQDGAAAGLAVALDTTVLRVSVADQTLDLSLYVYGELSAAYRSGDPAALAGLAATVERLIDATDARALPETVSAVLTGRYADPAARYAALAEALGVPAPVTDAGPAAP